MEKKNVKIIKGKILSRKGINPIEEIIKKYNIDTSIWEVDSFKIKDGKWNTAALKREQDLTWTKENQVRTTKLNKGGKNVTTTSNIQIMQGYGKRYPEFILADNKTYSIEITFKRIPVEVRVLESFKKIIKDIPAVPPIKKFIGVKRDPEVAAELASYDAHLAKLAWEKETGYRNYDLNIAIEDYIYTSDQNLTLVAQHNPKKIFYIIGQDMYHMDNMQSHTTGGDHTLDVDGRITKVHARAFAVSRDNILKCCLITDEVEVIWIPGNHDYLVSYMLCFALKEHFRGFKNIIFDIGENPRKARLWGNLLVGWTHTITGRHNVWSNELAQAFPELWGQSKFREWHHGDQHKKHDVKIVPTFTSGGVLCRQITALSPVDRWHQVNLFTDAVPGGEAFLWSKTRGVFANYIAWTGQYEEYRNKLTNKV